MIQDYLDEIEEVINAWLETKGVANSAVLLDKASTADFGDYSTNVAMRYAKELGSNPLTLAEEIVQFFESKALPSLAKVEAVKPGFINFYFTPSTKKQHLKSILSTREDFGKNHLHQNESWVVEHTSPNPNKAMHLAHLRNNLIGMGIVRLLKNAGAEVTSDCVYNNRGIAIAKVMYGYLAFKKNNPDAPTDINYWFDHQVDWQQPAAIGVRPDVFVTECYIAAEEAFKADKNVEDYVRGLVVAWEAEDKTVWSLWETVLEFAYAGMQITLDRIGNHWDKIWYEHEHYRKGKAYVEAGLAKGLFTQLEDGAILTNLESGYGLSDTVLLKNDGTSLYITQDIALTDLKKKTYNADKLVWVIGPDQSLALKQLFAVCEQLEIGKLEDFTHVPYGYVGLKDETGAFKKMSSRAGTVLLIDDLLDEVKDKIQARYDEEGRQVAADLSEKLALAAVKFSLLRSDRNQDLAFDVEQSVDIHGDSGMYVMYTYVRTQSILRKAGVTAGTLQDFELDDYTGPESELLRNLMYFEEAIKKSTTNLSVHHVAQYLLEICSDFNSWYAKESILDGSNEQSYKLALVEATAITIKNGLAILGIETVEEM